MTEKGGPVIMVALLFGLFWLCSEPTKKPEPMPDSSALIEAMQEASKTLESSKVPESDFGNTPRPTVKESFTVQPEHIPDATKMIDPQPSPSDKPHEKTKREVLIFVSRNCPPCEKWKRCEMNRFLNAGWSVGIVEVHSYGLTPTFEIESGDKKATIKGYTTLEQAAEAVR
jgi:protein-disulfide isomerase